jgi:hypothetical protein
MRTDVYELDLIEEAEVKLAEERLISAAAALWNEWFAKSCGEVGGAGRTAMRTTQLGYIGLPFHPIVVCSGSERTSSTKQPAFLR